MATGTVSDFKVYNDQINGNFFEVFMRNTDAFNEASRGAIVLSDSATRGDYAYESFYTEGPAVERRDPTDVGALTDNAMTQVENVSVKLHRRRHQALTRSQWLAIGKDPAEFGQVYGAQLANAIVREQLDRGLAAANAAISNVSALLYDASGSTIATTDLPKGLAKFGDMASQIVCWVMHSKPYFDLVGNQISLAVTNVTDIVIAGAAPITFNRPVIVTDSASLTVSATATRYITLGLTRGAIECLVTEPPYTASEEQTGLGNLVRRLQTEYSYNLGLRGFKYTTGSGINPTDGTVATAGSWTQSATDNKSLPGIRIRSQ